MLRFSTAVAIAIALLGFCAPRTFAQATASATATVSAPADQSTATTSSHTVGTPPYTYTVQYADITCTSTHGWSITGANPNQTFNISYSCTLTADGVQRDQYYNPGINSGLQWTQVAADNTGEWRQSKTLSGPFNPGARQNPYAVEAYTEISTQTLNSTSASDTNYVTVVNP